MKISSVLLQVALIAAFATSSSFAERATDNQHSKPDFAAASSSSLSGSFDGSHEGHHHRGDIFRDGSGSGLSDIGFYDGSLFHDSGSLDYDDGSYGSGFPCDRLFGSYSGSYDSSSSSSSRPHKRHFRGDVGDDYDFGSGDNDSDDSFDGSGSSSGGEVRCHRYRYKFGSGSGSGSEGSLGFYGDVGEYQENDGESSGSFDSPRSRHHHHRTQDSKVGSGSGDSHRLRGSRMN